MSATEKALPERRLCQSCRTWLGVALFPPSRAKGKQWRCNKCAADAKARRLNKRF